MIPTKQSFLFTLIAFVMMISAPTSGLAKSASRSAADQRLYEKARAACKSPAYPNGTRPYINYAGGWFRCFEPKSYKR